MIASELEVHAAGGVAPPGKAKNRNTDPRRAQMAE